MTSKPRPTTPGSLTAWSASSDSYGALSAARQAGPGNAPVPAAPGDERLAALSYLGVPFLGPCLPVLIYLLRKRRSGFVRGHGAQALNLSLTMLLYGISGLIAALMLALDSLTVALAVVVPLAAALWLVILGYVIVASASANRGGFRRLPAWLCATIVR
jgi:uncharacterized Tic20 family protein